MVLKHRVALDGVELDSIDDRIMISRVETGDGKENISTVSLWDGVSGSRVTAVHRDSLDVTVKFRIRLKKRQMAEREEVLEKVNIWAAAGGVLTTNNKPGRKITVFRAQAAGTGDPWDWTKEYSIIFRACGVPFWQESEPTTVTVTGTQATAEITAGGSEPTAAEVSFTNTSGSSCGSFTVQIGEESIGLSSLALAAGETLVIDRPDNGKRCYTRIRIRSTGGVWRSVLEKRSSGSYEALTVMPGTNSILMIAQRTGEMTVSVCGRFA